MKQGGIYEIVNTANGRRYIGSAVSFTERWAHHRNHLRRGQHTNQKLQRAWGKYGPAAFEFRPLMMCFDPAGLIPWERRFMDWLKPEYNIRPIAGSARGIIPSAATRAKLSAALKISAHMKGKTHSAEMREKFSAAKRGRSRGPHSAETRAKISASRVGLRPSTETRAKISAANTGRTHSAESRARLSASLRRAYAEGRRGAHA